MMEFLDCCCLVSVDLVWCSGWFGLVSWLIWSGVVVVDLFWCGHGWFGLWLICSGVVVVGLVCG